MAGKPKNMSQIKQLLQLHKKGESKRSIARILDLSRNTVKTYLNKLSVLEVDIDELLAMDNPVCIFPSV
jgi:DNA invertase Pin-like site-specific DNA recombinase